MSSIPAQTSALEQLSLFFNNDLKFIQNSLNTITNTFDRTEGEYSKKNNLIIINITSPYKENYYINDKNIEIHDLDFDQIRTIPLSEIEDMLLINFLRNQSLETYDIKNINEDSFKLLKNDKEYDFEFIDKDELHVKFTDNMNLKNIVKFYIKLWLPILFL